MLKHSSLAKAYVVIDALDECENDLPQLLDFIIQNTSEPRIKWVVSSRNRHDIERLLKPNDSQTRLSLELKANAEHVSQAVGVYINDRVSQIEALQDDTELRDQVRSVLRQKAGGMFLWAVLVAQELQQVESWDLLDVLNEMPTDLETLYRRMMSQIKQLKRRDPEYCQLVLAAVSVAYRPLHMLELGIVSELPEKISRKAESIGRIVKMCASFLTIQDDHVFVVHQSAMDYLGGKRMTDSRSDIEEADATKFPTSQEANAIIFPDGLPGAHRHMFRRSLRGMYVILRRDVYGLGHPGFSVDDLTAVRPARPDPGPSPDPLAPIRYACVHWIDHLCDANSPPPGGVAGGLDEDDVAPVDRFLQHSFLYWVEALSLCEAVSEGIFAIAWLEGILRTAKSKSILVRLIVDAHRFLLYNGWAVKKAPLQAYVSVLLFTPWQSAVRELVTNEEPSWVLTKPTVSQGCGALVKTLQGHDDWVSSVAFSPNGRLLASASSDSTIKLWDPATGEVQHTLQGHGRAVRSVAFPPNGRLLASASHDGIIKFWDMVTGSERKTITLGYAAYSVRLAYADGNPDCSRLLLLTERGTIPLDLDLNLDVNIDGKAGNTSALELRGWSLSDDRSWVTWKGRNAIGLPEDARPGWSHVWRVG